MVAKANARSQSARPSIPGKLSPPPRRPSRPADSDPGEIISITRPPEGEETPEPERVPLFAIGDDVYTMLKEPPPTIGIAAIETSDAKGGAGFGEVYLLREMMGPDALRALLDAGERGWLTRAQYDAISRKVMAAALGVEEGDLPNR